MALHRLLTFGKIVGIGLVLAASLPARASSDWMPDEDLKTSFGGKSIDGHYADGMKFSERYEADGRVVYREGGSERPGHWSVQAGSFCTIYDNDAGGGCFRVRRVGLNCYEFYFVARTEAEAREPEPKRPAWTARGWLISEPSSCAEGAAV